MKTILITGSNGYIGLRLSHFLKDTGAYKVIHASRQTQKNEENIGFSLEDSSNYEQITKNIDCVIHLAGKNFKSCEQSPEVAFSQNRDATIKLYEACTKNNVQLFIYASTAHVYGSPLVGLLTEDMPTTPISMYAKSKNETEKELKESQHSTKVVVLRLANIVGSPIKKESCDWNLIINSLCRDVFLTKQIALRTDGKGIRNFLSIRDFEKSVLKLLSISSLSNFEIINLGGPQNYTMLEIATIIQEEYNHLFHEKIPLILGDIKDPSSFGFEYSTKRAESHQLAIGSDIRQDIRDMLLFCNENFNNV
jgi:UDP-glucose 4-epimerase